MRRGLALAAGAALLAVAVGYCVRTFVDERARISDALGRASVPWLVVTAVLAALTMATIAAGWARCLGVLGARRPLGQVVAWFFVGELGKYVPGGIWPVLGRGELARQGGVRRVDAYRSVALSLAAFYGAAVLPLGVLAVHPRIQGRASGLVARTTRGRIQLEVLPWRSMVAVIVGYVPSWLLAAGSAAAAATAYGASPGWRVPVAAVGAWVCGFLAVPVPAGAGVREAVFVATSGLDPGLALVAAVTWRLALVAADLLGAAVSAPRVAAHGLRRAGGR